MVNVFVIFYSQKQGSSKKMNHYPSLSLEKGTLDVKETHREKAPSNKTPALKKSTNMGVWDCWYIKSVIYKRFLN